MRRVFTVLVAGGLVTLVGCSKQDEPSATDDRHVAAVVLNYIEQEPGIEPYPTRLIVTPEFARFDDGEGSPDYVLFERATRTIYSVSTTNSRVIVVPAREVDIDPPVALQVEEKDLGEMADAPTIGGLRPRHYQYWVNGELCYDVVTVPGLQEPALIATREYRQALAGDSATTFNSIPADMRHPCNMAMDTFAPNMHLGRGLPVQEWSPEGYSRALLDLDDDYRAARTMFEVPLEFQQVNIRDLRGG